MSAPIMPPFSFSNSFHFGLRFLQVQFPPGLRHLHAQPACPHVVPLLQLVAQFRHIRESFISLLPCLGTGVCIGCREEANPLGQSRQYWCWCTRAAVLPKGMTTAAEMMESRGTWVCWLGLPGSPSSPDALSHRLNASEQALQLPVSCSCPASLC